MAATPFARSDSECESAVDCAGWDAHPPVPGSMEGRGIELVALRLGNWEECPDKAAGFEPGHSGQENQEQSLLPKDAGEPFADPRIVSRRLLDDYRPDGKVLGTGVNGKVFSAVCKTTGRKVAVKSFKKLSMSREQWQDVQSEVQAFMALDHPHIAQLLQVYQEGAATHLVMECLGGGELFSRAIALKRFSESQAAGVARQVLRAVAYLHAHGFLHGDLKLENLLYERQDSAHLKLIDFGHAQKLVDGKPLTRRCGTLQYMAPEVHWRCYTEKADMWSVGVLVYMLLLGCHLYTGSTTAIQAKVAAGRPDYARSFAHLSEGAQSFVRALLEKDPSKRLSAGQALRHPWLRSNTSSAKAAEKSIMRSLSVFPATPLPQRKHLLAQAQSLVNDAQAPLRDHFHALDRDGDGVITLNDLSQAFGSDHAAEAGLMFTALDIKDDGEITWSEYVAATMPRHTPPGSAEPRGGVRFSLLAPAARWGWSVKKAAQVARATLMDSSLDQ